MTAWVALLRGINVGGNNLIAMADLRASFERLGFTDVASYINSGNILFRAKEKDARKLEKKIDAMLAKQHELPGRTVVRSRDEMTQLNATIDRTWKRVSDDWRYYVVFLRHEVDAETVLDDLTPSKDIEEITYCPGTLLWRVRAADAKGSALEKVGRTPIYKEITIRNLNTTRKVFAMMEKMCP